MKVYTETKAVSGFTSTGVHCGIRKVKKDMALIVADTPATVAGVFTQNLTCAAPVTWSKSVLMSGTAKAILINSGNANACTGPEGMANCEEMAIRTAKHLDCAPEDVFVSSTGIIGVPLPMENIRKGIDASVTELKSGGFIEAAEAILTTDTGVKVVSAVVQVDGQPITLTAIAKGSGMIHPNMATMLGFIMTDAQIGSDVLQGALTSAVGDTFNMISVDGDTSTNDMVLAMASGMSAVPEITYDSEAYHTFYDALLAVCRHLAIQIAKDGEGATKLLEATVTGAKTIDDARQIAKSVVCSSLVKSAFFGQDANWGRILCAMGYSSGHFQPEKVDLSIHSVKGKIELMHSGEPVAFSEATALQVLEADEVKMHIHLNDGEAFATAWGCDLTYEYVRINGEYRT